MTIAPTLTVTQLLRLHPAALPILTTAGIDTCLTFDQLAARLPPGLADSGARVAPSCGCERKAG